MNAALSFFQRWPKWAILVVAVVPMYLTWTFDHSLWNPDETRDAGIAAEMYHAGRLAVPTLNGEAFLEKPPLYYWACALAYQLTGRVSAGTTRVPSALFGVLGVLFTFLLGQRLFNERAGLLAAGLLATSFQYFRMSHFAMMDVALAALAAGALYFHVRGSAVGYLLFTILAFYAKGFLGVVITGLVVVADLAFERKPKQLAWVIGLGAVLFAALVAPWFWALWKEGGRRYLEIFLIDNHWKRFTANGTDHTGHPFYFYFGSFAGDFLPWTPLVLAALVAVARERRVFWANRGYRFVFLWCATLFAFFTVSSSKRSIYLLPMFPAAALLAGAWLDRALENGLARWEEKAAFRYAVGAAIAIALVLAGGVLVADPSKARAAVVAVAAVGAGSLLWRIARAGRGRAALTGALVVAGFCIALSSVSFVRLMDREKTFLPLCDAARAKMDGAVLGGFAMNEMERGVFGFYLGGPFQNPVHVEDLAAWLANETRPVVLIVNRTRLNDVEPVVQGRLARVFEYRPEKRTRSYVLFASRD